MAPLLTRYKVVGLGSASDASLDNPTKYPYFFSQSTLANTVTADGATWIATHPGVKKVALITSNDALGQADIPTLQATLKAKGISSVVELFDPTATDYTSTFQAAAAAKPDWVWMDGKEVRCPKGTHTTARDDGLRWMQDERAEDNPCGHGRVLCLGRAAG